MAALNTLPLSYKVQGRRIVIVGGGDEALNKARLAVRTSAAVFIVGSSIEADFTGLAVTVQERPFAPADLDGAALCFVADHGADGEAAKAAARDRGIPLNVVDVPDECDFYTPSIVDRAPLTVAIGSEGDAPVLARLVRARIEAMLPPELGPLAALAGAMREKVAALLPGVRARRYYEDLVTSPQVGQALGQGGGKAAAEALLQAHAGPQVAPGVVWLIGAGPGAEDLLTLRAQRLLQEADVIVHDALVPAAVIDMGRRDAERLSVGKQKGHHSFTQARINALLVRLAREGKRVARLKGGDPMVFGRASEEIAALRSADIAYAIVPGVSAALAAAADTATPVTLRKVSSGLVFAAAHGASDGELRHWASLSASGITLALYMGKSIAASTAIRLIIHGMPARTPVGIVVNAGRAARTLHRGTLGELADGGGRFGEGPGVILVGEAVAAGDWADAAELAAANFKVA
ncbi:MAG TPA: siroheme synthase CysG [Devosiaceae bacterium]|jgi:uroporphyrin-III C-methyltransferase/precorrin-2 dehydrogenase/sirohydrochlorin ferrochelatase|nr:siroheme synthase CysG [Devosiaceae bacterium]